MSSTKTHQRVSHIWLFTIYFFILTLRLLEIRSAIVKSSSNIIIMCISFYLRGISFHANVGVCDILNPYTAGDKMASETF